MSLPFNTKGSWEFICRGVSNKAHDLTPSIGRRTEENTHGNIRHIEDTMLTEFKRLTIPVLQKTPETDWEWLFLAQHYGLPTRLLDWSSNPLVGLYFATERNDENDGAVYFTKQMTTTQYEIFDYRTADHAPSMKGSPASIFSSQPNQGEVIFIKPKYTDKRYLNQCSVFSSPSNPFPALCQSTHNINKIIIPGKWKAEIRTRLKSLGISASYIYPGLSGAASEVKSLKFEPVASGNHQII